MQEPGKDGAPARKLTETEKALRRLRRKRLEASQPKTPSVEEDNEADGTDQNPKRRRTSPKHCDGLAWCIANIRV